LQGDTPNREALVRYSYGQCALLRCTGILYSTVPPGVDVGCVGQESSHKRIVVVSCLSARQCKGRLERPRMTAWRTQRRSDSKRFRGDAMPFFYKFNSPPLYLPLTVQVQSSSVIYRSSAGRDHCVDMTD